MTTLDFTQHDVKVQLQSQLSEGFSAHMAGQKLIDCPYFPQDSDLAQAWRNGWQRAATYLRGK